ncbi:thyrotropin-releasing hormone-degrading ectoenzyme-like isoform X1 [Temnothorax curvispinosus]|uniref:Aminopeptidase n=2 Tax=Temnothorax curvispinosus TaxID=300111 RepID=A0A6J1PPL0_9HYME|nr:thyrotropin-releasing hormone-degrading ectoenzyme-like isoform X1 [Temnothorax curvispinosus]
MELLKLLFNIMFIMAFVSKKMFITEVCADIYYRLPNNTIPKHYEIKLKVDVEKNIFHGKSNVSIIIYEQTRTIHLHSICLNITTKTTTIENIDMRERTKHMARSNHQIVSNNISYWKEMEVIVIYFDYDLTPGNYTLNMEYMGIISDMSGSDMGGFFKIPFINEIRDRKWFVTTHNSATGIRRTFPCWDEPRIKARFKIIVQHHINYTALSNTLGYTREVDVNDGIVQTYFEETPAIPIYLVAIVLCNFPYTNIFENLRDWQRFEMNAILRSRPLFIHNDLIFARHVIANITRYFQDEWRQWRVFPMQEHVAVPGLIDDGMTTKWELTFYRDEDIIYDKEKDNIARKMDIACLIGRKIARQLLNSETSPSWWNHFWLNEGIAGVLFTSKIIDKIIPNSRMSDFFVVQILQESLYLDGQGIMKPLTPWERTGNISDINSIFSFSYYIKAPAILRMVLHIVGEQVFWNGIEKYLKKQSATSKDFWAAVQIAYNETSALISSKINITQIIYPWRKQSHYPILNVTCDKNENSFIIRLKNPSETWRIPLTYTRQSKINFDTSPASIVTFKDKLNIPVPLKDDWIILNLQQSGYYRVNYDTEIWRRIACYLNSKNYKNIHVLNRAQIIDDAFYFTMTSQLNVSIFWELTSYLGQETEYAAWYPMIKVLERISYILPFPNKSEYFKTMILEQLKSLLGTLEYSDESNDDYLMECLRQEAVKWACVLNDSNCKTTALNKLQRQLTDLVFRISPGWKKWTYCNGLSIANKAVLTSVCQMYMYETLFQRERKSLEFLACSKHFYINFIMKSEDYNETIFKTIKENDIDNIKFFHYNVAKHARDNSVLDHILENWERAKPIEISTTIALIDIINHVYSKEQLDKIPEFVRNMKIESLLELTVSPNRSCNSKLFKEIRECMRNSATKLISDIDKKIDVRLSQIENQKNTFISVFGNNSTGRKIEDCNA